MEKIQISSSCKKAGIKPLSIGAILKRDTLREQTLRRGLLVSYSLAQGFIPSLSKIKNPKRKCAWDIEVQPIRCTFALLMITHYGGEIKVKFCPSLPKSTPAIRDSFRYCKLRRKLAGTTGVEPATFRSTI